MVEPRSRALPGQELERGGGHEGWRRGGGSEAERANGAVLEAALQNGETGWIGGIGNNSQPATRNGTGKEGVL
jgi:hypothetical protein